MSATPLHRIRRPGGWIAAALIAAAAGLAAGSSARAASPQALMKEGRSAYTAGRTEEALKKFEAAAKAAEKEGLDPAPADFNQGTALLKLGQETNAEPFLARALRTPDLRLQGRTWYNRAHALADRSAALAGEQKLQEAQSPLEAAIGAYENAITLDPADPDAKVNYELAVRTLEELKKQIEQQKQQQQQNQDQDKKDQDKKDQDKKDGDKKDQDQGKKDQDQPQQPDDGKKDEPQKPEPQQGNTNDTQSAQGGEPKREEMTPEEARMLLDAMKDEEEAGRDKLRLRLGQPVPVDKNW